MDTWIEGREGHMSLPVATAIGILNKVVHGLLGYPRPDNADKVVLISY